MINKLIRPPSTLDADAVSYGVYKNQKHVQKNKNRLSFVVEQKQNYAPTLHAFSCWQRTTTATMELITLIYFLSSRFSLQCAGLGYGRIIYFFLCPFGVGKVIEWHCSITASNDTAAFNYIALLLDMPVSSSSPSLPPKKVLLFTTLLVCFFVVWHIFNPFASSTEPKSSSFTHAASPQNEVLNEEQHFYPSNLRHKENKEGQSEDKVRLIIWQMGVNMYF